MVECLLRVSSPHENDIGDTLALSLGIVGERARLDRSAGLVEQFLMTKIGSGEDTKMRTNVNTHPNSGFIYIHGQVADDDLERILCGLVEGCDRSLLLCASSSGNSTGISSTRATWSRGRGSTSSSTGTASLGVLVGCLAAGDELIRRTKREEGRWGVYVSDRVCSLISREGDRL